MSPARPHFTVVVGPGINNTITSCIKHAKPNSMHLLLVKKLLPLTLLLLGPLLPGQVPSESWSMHVIDNTSFGSDGTKVCEVNGDGYEDIICGWEQGNVARLYINPIDGDQWEFIEVKAPDVEDALVVDIDNDGFKDIITFSEGTHQRITFHWAPNNGDYMDSDQWKSVDVPCTIDVTQWMFGEPMNVDNKNGIDLIVAAKNKGAILGWLESPLNPRDLASWKLHPIANANWIMTVKLIDMDHDGQQDILVTDRNGNTNGVKWFKHPGPGFTLPNHKWSEHLIGMEKEDPMFLDIVQLPDSGLWEIWVPNLRKELVHFVQTDSTGMNWKSQRMFFPESAGLIGKSAALGDIDGDGRKDLVTTYDHAKARSGVMWSSMDMAKQQWRHHDISGKKGIKFDFAYLTDMDRDGDLDVLTCEENNNSSTVAGLGVIWYENPFK